MSQHPGSWGPKILFKAIALLLVVALIEQAGAAKAHARGHGGHGRRQTDEMLKTKIVIAPSTQSGPFLEGHDVGPMNPHSYRPNEFFANDLVFEGLVAWDPDTPKPGIDGIRGTPDDSVVASLASSWKIESMDDGKMKITFQLTPDVTFHDGEKWDAAAAKINFDHIMGGKTRSRGGFHDWYGLAAAMESWRDVDSMTFEVVFAHYYEPALRELSVIRPFRMSSPKALPSIDQGYISCNDFKKNAPRIHGLKGGGYPDNPIPGKDILTCSGVSAPIGTGPYKVVDKLVVKRDATGTTLSSRSLPANKFNASCWQGGCGGNCALTCKCVSASESGYTSTSPDCVMSDEFVSEVRFEKFDGHRSNPRFDQVIIRAYKNQQAISDAMLDGSLDMMYGVGAISPSTLIRLATQEGGSLVAHRASHVINTRAIVLNSLSPALDTPAKRKLVMSKIDRQPLIDGELAEEKPAEALFDPEMPYCDVPNLKSIKDLADSAPIAPITDITSLGRPLRFIYKVDVPHEQIIASKIISDLYTSGIQVEPIVLAKDDYNAAMNSWLGPDWEARTGDDARVTNSSTGPTPATYCTTSPPVNPDTGTGCVSFDLAYSETWGPPYDPTSKLFDMTYEWGSGEADAVATSNLLSKTADEFKTEVRGLSKIAGDAARQAAYDSLLTTLHEEAVFLPLTRKKNVAIINSSRVAGFQFGSSEFDMPIAAMYPASDESYQFPVGGIIGIVVGVLTLFGLAGALGYLIVREKRGKPAFSALMQNDNQDAANTAV